MHEDEWVLLLRMCRVWVEYGLGWVWVWTAIVDTRCTIIVWVRVQWCRYSRVAAVLWGGEGGGW